MQNYRYRCRFIQIYKYMKDLYFFANYQHPLIYLFLYWFKLLFIYSSNDLSMYLLLQIHSAILYIFTVQLLHLSLKLIMSITCQSFIFRWRSVCWWAGGPSPGSRWPGRWGRGWRRSPSSDPPDRQWYPGRHEGGGSSDRQKKRKRSHYWSTGPLSGKATRIICGKTGMRESCEM